MTANELHGVILRHQSFVPLPSQEAALDSPQKREFGLDACPVPRSIGQVVKQ